MISPPLYGMQVLCHMHGVAKSAIRCRINHTAQPVDFIHFTQNRCRTNHTLFDIRPNRSPSKPLISLRLHFRHRVCYAPRQGNGSNNTKEVKMSIRPNIRRVTSEQRDELGPAIGIVIGIAIGSMLWVAFLAIALRGW